MKFARIMKHIAVASALIAAVGTANAGVVTFENLRDFQNYSEAGMDMTSDVVWNWPDAQMAHMDEGVARFMLSTGGTFNLNSVDVIADGGDGPARFAAYLDGGLLGYTDLSGSAGTHRFDALFQNIDELRVSIDDVHFTFDNLAFEAVSEVPEPASIALLGLGAAAFLGRRRKTA